MLKLISHLSYHVHIYSTVSQRDSDNKLNYTYEKSSNTCKHRKKHCKQQISLILLRHINQHKIKQFILQHRRNQCVCTDLHVLHTTVQACEMMPELRGSQEVTSAVVLRFQLSPCR